MGENAAPNDKVVQPTKVHEFHPVLFHLPEYMLSHHSFIPHVVRSHPSIEISHQDVHVFVLQLVQDCLKSVVEFVLGYFFMVIGECVSLNHIHPDVFIFLS